ncbi:hypothetical protein GGTG_08123 [Gaeumannomyces tritici R3-111a-1]|uniref:Uncharacterized protein n=1 Tax=Gaeumannomyces tritici (strain R3-111a-1) TaxID=644352 RepID=J3P3N6_GAET3|nr:hypothetical protein GGTG_08123 [Gaeumannomyces tritici R3-111a-1]EJT74280.1 hypothetical protein GGTG_08123 [Gaeumannomyces tritici R3-111a-1]
MFHRRPRESTSSKRHHRCAEPRCREPHSSKEHHRDAEGRNRRDDHHPRRPTEYYRDGYDGPEERERGYEARYPEAGRDHAADYWPPPHARADGSPVDAAGRADTPFTDASQQPYYYAQPATHSLLPPPQQQQQEPHSPAGQPWSPAPPSSQTYWEQHGAAAAPSPAPFLSRVAGWDTDTWEVPAAEDGRGCGGGSGRGDAGSVAGRRQTSWALGDAANTEIVVSLDPRYLTVPLNLSFHVTIDATGRIAVNTLSEGGPG